MPTMIARKELVMNANKNEEKRGLDSPLFGQATTVASTTTASTSGAPW